MKTRETVNIIFCGTGGQGVLKASEICAWAALLDGYHVKKSEVHGMSQRGGSVESHLRFGSKVYSPLVPRGQADFLIPLHSEEAAALKDFLSPSGRDYSRELETAGLLPQERRYLNSFMCGRLAVDLPLKKESWLKAIGIVFGKGHAPENRRVFLNGYRGSK